MTLNTMIEENEYCWHADGCELYTGVRQGARQASFRIQNHADSLEQRVCFCLPIDLPSIALWSDSSFFVLDACYALDQS